MQTDMSKSRENFIGSAAIVINEYTGVELSVEKVSEIIGDKMDSEWKIFEYKEVSPFMDTSPREEVVDIIARHYLGRPWPTYMDKIDIHEFCAELKEKMEANSK